MQDKFIKTLRKEIEGNFLNLIQRSYKNLQLTRHLMVKDECFPPKVGNR